MSFAEEVVVGWTPPLTWIKVFDGGNPHLIEVTKPTSSQECDP
jgi:hypothetical protein